MQLEEPGETVRPLERDAARALQVAQFARDPLAREAHGQRGARPRHEGRAGMGAREPRQEPVTMYGRVPVVATAERRCQGARRQHVCIARECVGELVRVLLVDAGERQLGEALDRRRRQGLGRARDGDGARQQQDRESAGGVPCRATHAGIILVVPRGATRRDASRIGEHAGRGTQARRRGSRVGARSATLLRPP